MDISNYVVSVSMAMSHVQTQYSTGIAIAKKAMDVMDMEAQALTDMLSQGAPSFGRQMDIRV
jgi:hypothetical protein